MKKARSFEDLEIWQVAKAVVIEVYRLSNSGAFSRDFGLRDQLRRASTSVMSNIAEGFERGSNRDFVRFLYIAKASAAEVRSQLYVAEELDYIDPNAGESLRAELHRLSRRIAALIKYLSQVD